MAITPDNEQIYHPGEEQIRLVRYLDEEELLHAQIEWNKIVEIGEQLGVDFNNLELAKKIEDDDNQIRLIRFIDSQQS